MGEQLKLTAADDFNFGAYLAVPDGDIKGGILVVQEIFGVNSHIREVCDGYAEKGYAALAPALFDRVSPGVELGYEEADMGEAFKIVGGLDQSKVPLDIQAGIAQLSQYGRVGVVGYCFGGTMAWLSACNDWGASCAVGYYGGQIAQNADLTPKIPVMLHFGELDAHIPMSDVNTVIAAHPDVPIHVYDADHGFNCDHRASYDTAAATTALERSLSFFGAHVG